MREKHLNIWLLEYIKGVFGKIFPRKKNKPIHVMFLFVDHFELAGKEPRLSEWLNKYPKLASRHQDADGVCPRHTWFYALDLMREEELEQMQFLVEKGFGEIELHWHHSHDSPESFKEKLYNGLSVFQKHGLMRPNNNGKSASFAFIHGNWSLDNSGGDEFCGVDNEIFLLKQAGCYADFTFPALYSVCQPATINSIYYVEDDGRPKSYNRGRKAQVGVKEGQNEFMIFEGPMTINWRDWHFKWHPTFEDGDIRTSTHSSPKRIDSWIRQNIHVEGKEDWIFVKVFCHGGQDYKVVLGDTTDSMFSYLESAYNDGERYILHYVTAREAYNIVKAAEDGKSGNPNLYRDYAVPPPFSNK